MKMMNDMELDQVNGGGTWGSFFNKVKDYFDVAKDIFDTVTGSDDDKEITVTHNEDGTVSASGGW